MINMVSTEFKQGQFSSIYPDGIENHYWTLARNKIIKRELMHNGLADKKILEIGCGKGVVVSFLRQAGLDCYGVELSKIEPIVSIRDFVNTGVGFEYLSNELKESTEVVMLLDVIEHIEDEATFISSVKKTFPKLCCILITVPAGPKLFSNYDVYNGHYRRYEFSTLSALEKKIGMRMLRFSYLFRPLYFSARLLNILGQKRKTKISPPKGVMIFAHKLLALFFVLEYLLLPNKLLGASAICCFYD